MGKMTREEDELKFLSEEYKKKPELFRRETFVDSPEFLETIGISYLQDDSLPKGYIKFLPYDFIVEEVSKDNEIQTVDVENFFSKNKPYSSKDPTIYSTVVKCELTTFEAVQRLSSYLNVDKNKIRFAGIKDKDAITSQLKSFRDTDIEKLKSFNSDKIFLKNTYSGKGTVEVGSLLGNRFTIFIRTDNSFNKKQFEKNLTSIKENGFINFFYSQRFGGPRFINWFWGMLILRGEYKNAVFSFLTSEGQREIPYFKKLRQKIKDNLENWDEIEKIIEPFPFALQNEIKVVKYLKKNPQDFVGALKQIPEQIQLWIFAYGSLLFNRKVSEYIRENKELPERLPLILSKDKNDWLPYFDFLTEDGIRSMPQKTLLPLPNVIWKKRFIKTREDVKIYNVKILPEGVAISFFLSKGCYATSFLSQLFQLMTGLPPKEISDKIIDTKEVLGEGSMKDLIEKFKGVVFSKSENIFEKFEKQE